MSRIFRVKGPPGTGKTSYLAERAHDAAAKYGGEGIAIASLTKTAATEIGGRDTPVPFEQIGTLHAHCYRTLDRPELAETPGGIRDFNASQTAYELDSGIADQVEDAIGVEAPAIQNTASDLHAAVMNHRARMTPRDQWSQDELDYAHAWETWKEQANRLDFTDLVERCLHDDIGHFAAPRVWLFDESQDFSSLELALAVKWSQPTETTVIVGDADQALYGWRGSDAAALDGLEVAGDRLLEQSHRVPMLAHAAADAWISQLPGRRPAEWRPTDVEGEVNAMPHSLRDTGALAAAVRDDLGAGRTSMVLTTCSYMLAGVIAELRAAGIPFHNPHRTKNGAWNPMRGAGRLAAFLRPSEAVWGEQARSWTWEDLRMWTEPLAATGTLARGAKAAIEETCRADRFGESRADQLVPTETLIELLGDDGTLNHPAFMLDVDWWEARLRAKTRKPAEFPLAVHRAQGGSALVDTPKVIVGTIHSVKGGQADSVHLCPDLSRAGFWDGWHESGPGRDAIVRMFYVGLTRARQTVTIMQPSVPEHVAPMDLIAGAQGART